MDRQWPAEKRAEAFTAQLEAFRGVKAAAWAKALEKERKKSGESGCSL
jgi:hypothetical protein